MWTDAAQLLNSRTAASSVVARKFATKLVQRIGLTFLPATDASWRYQQSSVSINESLSTSRLNSSAPTASTLPMADSNTSVSAQNKQQSDVSVQPTPAASAASQNESSGQAHGMTNGESSRPALQPSSLVNASPVTSPTAKAQTSATGRQPATISDYSRDSVQNRASAGNFDVQRSGNSPEHTSYHDGTSIVEDEAEGTDDDGIDIPEEIEEV